MPDLGRPEDSGVLRTPMGIYVLRDDLLLSRWIERDRMLTIPADLDQVQHVAHLIPEGAVVVEAGACLGDHTALYSQLAGWRGHVYAFEPHPVSYLALLKNTGRFRNVTTFPLALSDAPGQARLQIQPNIGASYVNRSQGVPVEVTTLDAHLLSRLHRCDFLHLDAEGYEPRILEGAKGLIECFHPAILTEVSDQWLLRAGSSERDYLAQLAELGYTMTRLSGPLQHEYDVLAVWRGR